MTLIQILKSKTIDANIVGGAVYTILRSFGIEIPTEACVAFFTLLNIVLRFITTNALADK